jgi:hypothetical protein
MAVGQAAGPQRYRSARSRVRVKRRIGHRPSALGLRKTSHPAAFQGRMPEAEGPLMSILVVMSWWGRIGTAVALMLATLVLPVAPMICALTTCQELAAVSPVGGASRRGGEAKAAASCHEEAQPSSTGRRHLPARSSDLAPSKAHECDHPPLLTSARAATAVRVPPAILVATLDGPFAAGLAARSTHMVPTPVGPPVPRPAATTPPVLRI